MMTSEDFGKFVDRHGGFMKEGKLHPDVDRNFDPDEGWEDIELEVDLGIFEADEDEDDRLDGCTFGQAPLTHNPFKGKI